MQDHGQCNIQKYMDYPRLITLTIHNIYNEIHLTLTLDHGSALQYEFNNVCRHESLH